VSGAPVAIARSFYHPLQWSIVRAWLVMLGLAGCDVVFRIDELPAPVASHATLVATRANAFNAGAGDQSEISVVLPGTQLGDLLVAAVCFQRPGGLATMTDDQGDAFTLAGAKDGARLQGQMWFAPNTRASVTTTITATFPEPVLGPDLLVAQYRGVTADPADGASLGFATSAVQATSDPVVTTTDRDLLVAAACVGTRVLDFGDFTDELTSDDGNALGDKLTTAAGAYSVTATQFEAQEAIVELAAFKSR
jgi:hypothetical protein